MTEICQLFFNFRNNLLKESIHNLNLGKMKKIITLILLWLLINSLKAQKYVPFPDSNALWEVQGYNEINCPPPTYLCFTVQYYINGDTSINTIQYHKLYSVYLLETQYPTYAYKGAIRQDTAQKKIFFWLPNNPHEDILYDFNLNIGDTLPETLLVPFKYWVTELDTVVIGGIARKKYLISCDQINCNGCYIIEGIGNSSGLLEPLGYFEGGSFLICFNQNDTTHYSPYGHCEIINDFGLVENIYEKIKISIHPNPTNDILYINIDLEEKLNKRDLLLLIYDSSGKGIKKRQLIINDLIELNVSNFKKGIYSIGIFNNGKKIFTDKFIKN